MIELKNVTVDFPVFNVSSKSLRKSIVRVTTGGALNTDSKCIYIRALENINLQVEPGTIIGINGHNGSGKSTLLRTIAGIYAPTMGTVRVNGRISTLFEIGAGLEAELSGADNISRIFAFLELDFNKTEIKKIIENIAKISGLGSYIYMPVRVYSSGMSMRLMFAISTFKDPEIFLVDEFLSVGDGDFRAYSEKRLTEMRNKSKATIIASQNMDFLRMVCHKIYMLNEGRIKEVRQ